MRLLLAASLCFFCLGCDPFVMIPGGALDGSVAPVPTDWAFSDATDTVQLETRPADPYSVNVWGIGVGPRFYIAAGEGAESTWAQHLQDDPTARVRIEDTIYELRATRVEDEAEIETVLAALKTKYDFEPDPEEAAGAWLFRFEGR